MAVVDRARVVEALQNYVVGEELGAGGFGLVLAGRHRDLGRDVAIKVLSKELDAHAVGGVGGEGGGVGGEGGGGVIGGRADGIDVQAEAQLLARLNHPHIVQIYDYIETPAHCFLVMELLTGGTLTRRRRALVGIPEAGCAVGLAAAEALAFAHANGVLHRDVKPDNMLFTGDNVLKVVDFGIAKMFEGSAVTASRQAGTPRYMSPEQIESGRLSPATDLYALGVVLYEMLSGTPLFASAGASLLALYRHHLEVPPAPPPGVPAPVASVVLRALAKQPYDRHPSAHAFAVDLAAAAAESYGPTWFRRTDLRMRLGGDLHEVVYNPKPLPLPPPTDSDRLVVPANRPPKSVSAARPPEPATAEAGIQNQELDFPDSSLFKSPWFGFIVDKELLHEDYRNRILINQDEDEEYRLRFGGILALITTLVVGAAVAASFLIPGGFSNLAVPLTLIVAMVVGTVVFVVRSSRSGVDDYPARRRPLPRRRTRDDRP